MRVAQVTYSYWPVRGGADVYADLLRRALEAEGHQVTVYQRPDEVGDERAVRVIRSPLAGLLGRRGEFWHLPLGLRGLRRELGRSDAVVAHYPNYHRMVEWHPRTVLVSHGVFWDDRPGALRSRIKRKAARRAYERAWQVVANDTFFLREVGAQATVGTPPFSEVAPGRWFVPNCVDTAMFRRGKPDARLTDGPWIVVPRNLYRNRGVALAIEAYAECRGALAGARLLVVGGAGDRGYLEECEALVRKRGLEGLVRFAGAIPWREMPGVYSGAALALIPTLCGEGTSLAALEAMACGVATVSTNVAGLADLPTVQSAPTAGALGEALVRTWRERDAVGEAQAARVRREFDLARWRRFWVDLLETAR